MNEALPRWMHANVLAQILFSISLVQKKEEIYCQNRFLFGWLDKLCCVSVCVGEEDGMRERVVDCSQHHFVI